MTWNHTFLGEVEGVSLSGISNAMESVLVQLPGWGMKLLGVLALFVVGRWLASRIGNALERNLERRELDKTLTRFFATILRSLMMVIVVLGCLSIFGVETTSVAAVLGAAALAVGLALQGSLANFAAGVMLVIFRPFRVGDVIRAAGETGKVDRLGLFTTTLDTPDNRRLTIPNSAIFGGNIENLSHHSTRRVAVPVGCSYAADLDLTRQVLEAAIREVPTRLPDAEHQVFLSGLGASSVDWEVRIWCKAPDFWTCRQETIVAVKTALDRAQIAIPFPQMDVHVDGGLRLAPPPDPASPGA